jgi:hypothetical protein
MSSQTAARKAGNGPIWILPKIATWCAQGSRLYNPVQYYDEQPKKDLLRHFLATLAYRARKVIVGAPRGFADFVEGHGVRKPVEILSHISSILMQARSFLSPAKLQTHILAVWG